MPIRLDLTISRKKAGPQEHKLEFEAAVAGAEGGEVRLALDGKGAGSANWARIAPGLYSILLDGCSYDVRVNHSAGAGSVPSFDVVVGSEIFGVAVRDPRARRRSGGGSESSGPREIVAPMPGKVVRVLVREGDGVEADQGLLVIEAMKMQNELRAPRAGRVEKVYASEGAGVETGARLVRLA